jgi:hypothetical protein
MKQAILKVVDAAGYSLVKKPEAVRHTLTPSDAAPPPLENLQARGFAVVRNALPAEAVRRARTLAEQWFAELDARDPQTSSQRLAVYRKQGSMSLSIAEEADTRPPHGLREIISTLLASDTWRRVAAGYDEPLVALVEKSQLRRQLPEADEHALGYHQDAAVIEGREGAVFWLPLTPVDQDTPGLEVVTDWPADKFLPHGHRDNGFLEFAENVSASTVALNDMRDGDIGVFKLSTPHRTLITEGMNKPRISIDVRAVPLSGIPKIYRGWAIIGAYA